MDQKHNTIIFHKSLVTLTNRNIKSRLDKLSQCIKTKTVIRYIALHGLFCKTGTWNSKASGFQI